MIISVNDNARREPPARQESCDVTRHESQNS